MFTIKLASDFQTIEFQVEDLDDEIISKAIDKVNYLGNNVYNSSVQKAASDIKMQSRRAGYLATDKQLQFLAKIGGKPTQKMTKEEARKAIDEILKSNAGECDW